MKPLTHHVPIRQSQGTWFPPRSGAWAPARLGAAGPSGLSLGESSGELVVGDTAFLACLGEVVGERSHDRIQACVRFSTPP